MASLRERLAVGAGGPREPVLSGTPPRVSRVLEATIEKTRPDQMDLVQEGVALSDRRYDAGIGLGGAPERGHSPYFGSARARSTLRTAEGGKRAEGELA